MKQLKVMLWYDVEDFITPQSDDALLALIDMMDSLGIRSSLKIVGEKIRVLQQRNRQDILRKLAGHEICYHTDTHSIHPTQTEYLNTMGFAEGAAEFERRERQGFLDLQEISGQFPTSYGQPGASWVPQVFPVLKKWGVPTYLDSHYLLNLNEEPFWYGGILNLTRLKNTMRLEEFTPEGLEAAKKTFDAYWENDRQLQLVSIYYHPCEYSTTQFWDGVNFADGKNTPRDQWKTSPLRTQEEMQRRVDLFGEFLRYTLTQPGVEYITAREACLYEKVDPMPITPADVQAAAAALTDGPDYWLRGNRSLCASELLSLFSRYVLGRHLTPELFYGPEADVPSQISIPVTPLALAEAVASQYDQVLGYKQLPSLYQVGENRLNPVDVFSNLGRAIAEGIDFHQLMPLTTGGTLQPTRHINTGYDWTNWVIFSDDLDASGIVTHALLQTWTLKPALY